MTIDELHEQFFDEELIKDSKDVIELFEQNYVLLNAEISDVTSLSSHQQTDILEYYAISLINREAYSKALPYIQKALDQLKSREKFEDRDSLDEQMVESLIFYRAIANYYLNNLNEAIVDINILVKKFPDNDKYKNWLAVTKNHNKREISNLLWYVVLINLVITRFVSEEDIGVFYDLLLSFSIICLITVLYYEFTIRSNNRKLKNS